MNSDTPDSSFAGRVADAKTQLLKIPGVVSVSLGYKETGKDLTNILSLRVYVEKKLKPEEVPPESLIPAEVNGIPTDVNERHIPGLISKGGTRPLVGGIQIKEYDDIQPKETGTLGCMAKRTSDNKHVVLSCQHVLNSTGSPSAPENDPKHLARQPERKDCCGFYYENIVGPIIAGVHDNLPFTVNGTQLTIYVDAAYALINSDVHSTNDIDKIGTIQGIDDLSPSIGHTVPANYQVRKKGRTTGLTSGTIVEINNQLDWSNTGVPPPSLNCILIRPDNGFKTLDVTYRIDPAQKNNIISLVQTLPLVTVTDLGNNRMKFSTKAFVDGGDSGSAIVNAQNKVVGVLFATSLKKIPGTFDEDNDTAYINTGYGYGCHIQPALTALGLTIEQGPVNIAADRLDLDELQLEEAEHAIDVQDVLARTESHLKKLPKGAELIDLFHAHAQELIHLVHHFRPVKVVWHRHHCPAFAVAFINTARDPSQVLPVEIKGMQLSQAVTAMRKALETHGSDSLRKTLERYGDLVTGMLTRCRKYAEMLQYLAGLQWVDISKGGTRPLVGGITVTAYRGTTELLLPGTLGCIAKRNGDPHHAVLSCQHVLESTGSPSAHETDPDHMARQPARKACSLFFHYENIVGPIIMGESGNVTYNGTDFFIDAAIANVNSDVHTSNEVQLIGTLQGTEDLTPLVIQNKPVPANYAVMKTGQTTHLTHGMIQWQPTITIPVGSVDNFEAKNVILIKPVPPYYTITETWTIPDPSNIPQLMAEISAADPDKFVEMTPSGDKITFKMKVFAAGGDSGAVLVNSQNQVVGMVFKAKTYTIDVLDQYGSPLQIGIYMGPVLACHIAPVMQAMDITIVKDVDNTAGDPLDLEDIAMAEAEEAADLETALANAESDLHSLPNGAELLNLIQRHGEEVIRLVHHYRPVKVVWHRNQCPAFAVSLINAVRDRFIPFHQEIKDVKISSAATALQDSFLLHGSEDLKRDVSVYGPLIIEALSSGNTYEDLLGYFKNKLQSVEAFGHL